MNRVSTKLQLSSDLCQFTRVWLPAWGGLTDFTPRPRANEIDPRPPRASARLDRRGRRHVLSNPTHARGLPEPTPHPNGDDQFLIRTDASLALEVDNLHMAQLLQSNC